MQYLLHRCRCSSFDGRLATLRPVRLSFTDVRSLSLGAIAAHFSIPPQYMNASMYRKGLFDGALSWLEDEVISVCVFVCVVCGVYCCCPSCLFGGRVCVVYVLLGHGE